MNRRVCLVAVGLALALSGSTYAQIKVVEKPAPTVGPDEEVVYTWTSSWGLRDDPPDKYPMGITTHKTKAEAVAAANAHIARTAGNGALAVTHYLIEGEPSVRKRSAERVKRGMDLLTRLKEAKEAVDHARKVAKGEASLLKAKERTLGDTIKEYKDMVAQSYRQVVDAKKTLTGGVAALTDAKFREVNGLIDKYNGEIQDFQAVMGRDASLGFSPMARVEPRPDPRTSLVGTWEGTYVQTGEADIPTTAVFNGDGTVTTNGGKGRGRWTLDGDSVHVTWSTGAVVTWRFSGDKISGSGTTPRGRSWSLTLRKQ
jgi:hypothetical protein